MTIKRWLEYRGNRTRHGRRRRFNEVSGEIMTRMTPKEAINEGLALHDMWRVMGYEPDDIFVTLSEPLKSGPPDVLGLTQVMMVLMKGGAEGDELFSYHIGFITMHRNEFMPLWKEATEMWNTKLNLQERRDLVGSTVARRQAVMLMTAMQAKGLRVSKDK